MKDCEHVSRESRNAACQNCKFHRRLAKEQQAVENPIIIVTASLTLNKVPKSPR